MYSSPIERLTILPSPATLALFYFWNVATALVLINVLISLFASAYSDVSRARSF